MPELSELFGLFEPKELPLVRDGQLLRRNMRRELISEAELMGKLREHGVANVKDVKAAFIERDGAIRAIKKNHEEVRL